MKLRSSNKSHVLLGLDALIGFALGVLVTLGCYFALESALGLAVSSSLMIASVLASGLVVAFINAARLRAFQAIFGASGG